GLVRAQPASRSPRANRRSTLARLEDSIRSSINGRPKLHSTGPDDDPESSEHVRPLLRGWSIRTTKPTTHWTCGASAAAVVIIRELELRLTSNALEPRAVATRIEAGIEPDRVRQHPAAGADDAE